VEDHKQMQKSLHDSVGVADGDGLLHVVILQRVYHVVDLTEAAAHLNQPEYLEVVEVLLILFSTALQCDQPWQAAQEVENKIAAEIEGRQLAERLEFHAVVVVPGRDEFEDDVESLDDVDDQFYDPCQLQRYDVEGDSIQDHEEVDNVHDVGEHVPDDFANSIGMNYIP